MTTRSPGEPAAHLTDLAPNNLLTRLTPGKVSLSRVPMSGDFVEISTPHWRHIQGVLDVMIEHDLVEVCLANGQDFNIYDYRPRQSSGGRLKAHEAFRTPVPGVIFSSDNDGNWQVDGKGLEIIDSHAVYSFLSKVCSYAKYHQDRSLDSQPVA